MTNKQEVLQQCKVEGLVVKLPSVTLDRKLYVEVKNALELIGGKWKGGKVQGFVFQDDPTELLQEIASGEKRNLKKEYQFFETPEKLADRLVELAEINNPDLMVLEPSAGQGAIVKALFRKEPNLIVHAYEIMEINRLILNKHPDCVVIGSDFLQKDGSIGTVDNVCFDRIVANPPFSKNQDIEHITEMYRRLAVNGILVSIASTHWTFSQNKKETEFKDWLKSVNASIIDIPAGTFKESGTSVPTVIIVIKK